MLGAGRQAEGLRHAGDTRLNGGAMASIGQPCRHSLEKNRVVEPLDSGTSGPGGAATAPKLEARVSNCLLEPLPRANPIPFLHILGPSVFPGQVDGDRWQWNGSRVLLVALATIPLTFQP